MAGVSQMPMALFVTAPKMSIQVGDPVRLQVFLPECDHAD